MQQHHQILIIGGGNAGISTAAQLLRKRPALDIAIIEPSEKHYYQPAWTLVGAGTFDINDTVRSEASVLPKGVHWIKDAATRFEPDQHKVSTASGQEYTYDYLVVAPGIQLNWHLVKGLPETLGKNGVTSNYSFELAPYTYELIKGLKAGDKALFTSPGTPVKCGGAPQKIMYLAADYLRKHGLLGKTSVEFVSAGSVIFGIKKYADELMKKVNEYGIQLHFKHDLVEINGAAKTAVFKVTDTEGITKLVTKQFDMIHVVPPQSAPDFIRNSPLANAAGWVDVNKATLQHTLYPRIFGIGDATSTPNAKTGAAVRKQAPVLVKNLLALIDGEPLPATYNGYGSCPLVVGYGKLILAEFDYDNKPTETFPFDQSKPRWTMWALKKYVLPWMYWNRILKGTA
ncbi:FAD/NAD(P)-binding oxidoreductase [Flavihumibacter sp. CACIAM 22H1]|uniref:NAD(P)/FAD-dependent oxidoreductase n=1 Tax=Flavihumibacter sp. CACIAM 22H1 TaxID=1812911 RepID=UPI0007A7E5AB|nr:FAD/NAD(P)-binding oxidoreductase [Flavihumibacter sp. CACIAM 22H1]KYP16378.1 MAG: pyridine nucleotide-disulfide oxidoreductase [Flavihumibacter sp. CACIAM 22H1]